MAFLKGVLQVTGSIKGVSFYTPVGSDKVIMRTKGGASKDRIATGAEFEGLRKHQVEWAGCVEFARAARGAVGELYRLADYNLSPVWTGLAKKLIKLDTKSDIGKRNIKLTNFKQALEGFNLNKKNPITSVLGVSPRFEIHRDALEAIVTFPRINTQVDLLNFQRLPYFRLLICLGGISDVMYNPGPIRNYEAENPKLQGMFVSNISKWHSTNDIIPSHTMTVKFDENTQSMMSNDISLILSIGVEFGNHCFGGGISEGKRSGCAKIIAVG